MPDVCVTVPKKLWAIWLSEGDLPGDLSTGREYLFHVSSRPKIEPGERVYVVAGGRLRGYAPLVRVEPARRRQWASGHISEAKGFELVRAGGAVAVTIPVTIKGFQGYQYRFWERSEEVPFPGWCLL